MASAERILRTAETQAEQVLRLERAGQRAAAGRLADDLNRLLSRAVGSAAISPGAYQGIAARLAAIFERAAPVAEAAIHQYVAEAFQLGLEQAAVQGSLARPIDATRVAVALRVRTTLQRQSVAARALLTSNDSIVPALAIAKRAVAMVDAEVTWQVNRAAADGVSATAAALGMRKVWVAERDACLICLAFQGVVADAEAAFSTPRQFGDIAPPTGLPNPPAHPHCRCSVHLITDADAGAVTALLREARRSVLKGWSLPSESEASRLRAADALLTRGASLPQSVEDAAARAVKRGEFRSRNVPSGK